MSSELICQKSISIGSDHAGFELKEHIINYLKQQNYMILDSGCFDNSPVDYPDYAVKVANNILNNYSYKGILICGSGSGMCITANKINKIRAVNCLTPEMVALAVQHNNANILCLGAKFLLPEDSIKIVKTFFSSTFEEDRHTNRINKIHTLTGL